MSLAENIERRVEQVRAALQKNAESVDLHSLEILCRVGRARLRELEPALPHLTEDDDVGKLLRDEHESLKRAVENGERIMGIWRKGVNFGA